MMNDDGYIEWATGTLVNVAFTPDEWSTIAALLLVPPTAEGKRLFEIIAAAVEGSDPTRA